jgi:hypothetical protein
MCYHRFSLLRSLFPDRIADRSTVSSKMPVLSRREDAGAVPGARLKSISRP